MAAVANETYIQKFAFKTILEEQRNKEKEAEEQIITMLSKYSSSSFHEDSWILDKKSNKSHPDSLSYKYSLNLLGTEGKYIAKLFTVIVISNGGNQSIIRNLHKYFIYLSEENLNLLQIRKEIFQHYMFYLDSLREKNGELLSESYKHALLKSALKFHTLMNGHSSLAFIQGIEAIENPYDRKSKDSKYKVIEDAILVKLDNIFSKEETLLFLRVAYWIMRLFGTRPEDTLNYPLDCVKKLSEDITTIKHAILKNSKNRGKLDYKIGFLNSHEPMQKMLISLIEKQQHISMQLQEKASKKGFLFTYQHETSATIQYLSTYMLSNYFRAIQRKEGIEESKRAIPRCQTKC